MTKPAKILELVEQIQIEEISDDAAAFQSIEAVYRHLNDRGRAVLLYLAQLLMISRRYPRAKR